MQMLRKHHDLPIAFNISFATPPTSVTITNSAIDSSENSSEMTEAGQNILVPISLKLNHAFCRTIVVTLHLQASMNILEHFA